MGTRPVFGGSRPLTQHDPATDGTAITPGSSELTNWARGLYIGGAGDLVVVTLKDTELILKGAAAGSVIPIQVKKVLAASTDSPSTATSATDIVGLHD